MNQLRIYRMQHGFTTTELANRLGVSIGLVSNIENGRIQPYPLFRKKVSAILKTPEKKIFKNG